VARARKRFKATTMSDHDQPVAATYWIDSSRRRRSINDGSVTRPSSSSGERQALPGRHPGPLLAVRRRLGAQRGE